MSVMTRRPRTAYLLLTGATTLALSACSGGETDPRTQPPLVRVATAAPVTGGTREFTGIVSSEGRRVGKGCVRTGCMRLSPYHYKQKDHTTENLCKTPSQP